MTGNLVRWTLLTPAIFPSLDGENTHPGGWLPSWIAPNDMSVQLKSPGESKRRDNEGRSAWRKRVKGLPPIQATLVSAIIPRAIPVTGWSLGRDIEHSFGAKAIHLAVPAGSVYYFECDSDEAAQQLAQALNWHGRSEGTEIQNRRSSLLGEKGFGLGVCSSWTSHL